MTSRILRSNDNATAAVIGEIVAIIIMPERLPGGGRSQDHRRFFDRRRNAIRTMDLEELHDWRKRTKYHRQHLRLVRFIWPPVIADSGGSPAPTTGRRRDFTR